MKSLTFSLMGKALTSLAALIVGALVATFAAEPVYQTLIPSIMRMVHQGKVIYLYDADIKLPDDNKDVERYLLLFSWASNQPSGRMIEITKDGTLSPKFDYILSGIHRNDLLSYTYQKRDTTATYGGGAFIGHASRKYPDIYVGVLVGLAHEDNQTTCKLSYYWAVVGDELQNDNFLDAVKDMLNEPAKKPPLGDVSMDGCKPEDKKPA